MAHTCTGLSGKVAIITGSSSGIGLAVAEKLAAHGTKVTLSGRNLESLAEAKKKCIAAGLKEGDICSVAGEITDEHTRERLVAETVKQFGKIDILVNNAGASPLSSIALGNANLQTFDKVFDINVRALVDLTMKAVPHLIKTKELGPQGVRVNTVSPGMVRTNLATSAGMSKEATKNIYEMDIYKKRQIIGRVGEPEDIANLIAFLVSDAASFVTGANYVSDGGVQLNTEGFQSAAAAAAK